MSYDVYCELRVNTLSMAMFDLKREFGATIRKRRLQLGISQEALAERAELHRTYIADIERGARNLSLESISKLARALEVSMGALFPPPNQGAAHAPETAPTDAVERVVDLLLVEEDPKAVQTALKAFGKAKLQNSVEVVRDGGAALDYLFCRRQFAHRKGSPLPAVVLLDLNLVKSAGMEVLKAMKSAEKMRRIRVVVLTDSSHDEHIREALRLGADAYIIKPVDFQKFSAVMSQLGFHWTLLKRKGVGNFFAIRPAPGTKPEESQKTHPGN